MDRLISRIRPVRPAMYRTRDIFLLHDNAPAYSGAKIQQILTQKQVATLNPPILDICVSPLLPVPEGAVAAEGCNIWYN
jgi:hypothetical protein